MTVSKYHYTRIDSRPDLNLYTWSKEPVSIQPLPPLDIPEYTDTEYDLHLKDPTWTKEETDHLFELARTYDLRFIIMHDRTHLDRSIEELKQRYYQVVRILLSLRLPIEDPQTKVEIQKYQYDMRREIDRKQHLEKLMQRSVQQMEEESMLLNEIQKFEMNHDKWSRTRDSLLKTHTDHQNKEGLERLSRRNRMSSASLKLRKPRDFEDLTVKRDRVPAGIHNRVSKIAALKPSTSQRVIQIMEEMGQSQRPKMPTEIVCARFEELRHLIQCTLEVKRAIEKAELDLKSAQHKRIAMLEEGQTRARSASISSIKRSNSGTWTPTDKRSRNF
ncbi:hypothetical protein EDD86DRAFT_190809 [Gorgonomyces haynaldii]|nr:hypothetical protein EDD86DRAFT_190809 [Gorgonomyces haynaldii]